MVRKSNRPSAQHYQHHQQTVHNGQKTVIESETQHHCVPPAVRQSAERSAGTVSSAGAPSTESSATQKTGLG